MAGFHKFSREEQNKQTAAWTDPYINSTVPSSHVWHPQVGPTYHFRVMPPWSVAGMLCLKIPTYYQRGLSQFSFVSPHYFEAGSDPFMNAFFELKPQYNDHKPIEQHPEFHWDYNQVRPNDAWLYNVVVMEEMAKGPQVWRATYRSEIFLEQLQAGEYGDITDPEFGYNLSLKIEKKGQTNQPLIMSDPRGPSKIADMSWADKLWNIDEVLRRPNPADVQAAFDSIPWRFMTKKPPTRAYSIPASASAEEGDNIPDSWPPTPDASAVHPSQATRLSAPPAPAGAPTSPVPASPRADAFKKAQEIRDKLREQVQAETPTPEA